MFASIYYGRPAGCVCSSPECTIDPSSATGREGVSLASTSASGLEKKHGRCTLPVREPMPLSLTQETEGIDHAGKWRPLPLAASDVQNRIAPAAVARRPDRVGKHGRARHGKA